MIRTRNVRIYDRYPDRLLPRGSPAKSEQKALNRKSIAFPWLEVYVRPKKGRMPISRRNSPTRALQTTAIMGFLQGIGNFLRRPGKLNQGIARDIRHLAALRPIIFCSLVAKERHSMIADSTGLVR